MKLRKQSGYSYARCATMLTAVAILFLMSGTSAFASGPLEKMIYQFQIGDGTGTSLIADQDGNLYGVTGAGPYCYLSSSCGNVFELSPPATDGGGWTKAAIYIFQGGVNDGGDPVGAPIFDRAGNLYGTTAIGGTNNAGTVFELSPPAILGGPWTETVLYSFSGGTDGVGPISNLILDSEGNLYGTAFGGYNQCPIPSDQCGTVYEVSPPTNPGGAWTEQVLHNFGGPNDGFQPLTGLVYDHRIGGLYGTTADGGSHGNGTVFQLVRDGGVWRERVIYSFPKGPVGSPNGALIVDGAGNLYGTAVDVESLGQNLPCLSKVGCGGIFKLSPPSAVGQPWTEHNLYVFTGGKDGANPVGSLLLDESGNLFGTTWGGGLKNKLTQNNGTIFELSPPAVAGEPWVESTLHDFGGSTYGDGRWPAGSLVAVHGKFYGTTEQGGPTNWGTAFCLVIAP